ncbi:MAG: DUF2956 domain-containing protein [Kangiellaceae bacterium]|nr:DUF2956 domain-containing protein [Kangiellaceae bacterium]
MAKYKTGPSKETEAAAQQTAKATQKSGQTKEQTKLIALGIQKGIEHYKKQQKSKSRELDKKLRNVKKTENQSSSLLQDAKATTHIDSKHSQSIIPWSLLVISWIIFIVYLQFN